MPSDITRSRLSLQSKFAVVNDGRGATNRATVTVTDQYGDAITGVSVQLRTDRRVDDPTNDDARVFINEIAGDKELAVGRDGSYTFGYEREGPAADTDVLTGTLKAWDHDGDGCTQTLIVDTAHFCFDVDGRGTTGTVDVSLPDDPDDLVTGTGTIQWAAVASRNSNGTDADSPDQIYAIDKETNTIFVGTDADADGIDDDSAIMVSYDDNDRFNFTGDANGNGVIEPDEAGAVSAVSYGRFEQELSTRAGHLLGWTINGDGYRATNVFTLTIPLGS